MVTRSTTSTDSRHRQIVSIIVPVYNAQKYLRYCLDSIVGQTYRHLQIILVDDGSTDASGSICDEYARTDGRIEVLHRRNGGIAAAQNTGLDAVAGEYIAFCDNDDIMHARNIEHLLNALMSAKADMAKGRWCQIGVSALSDAEALRDAGELSGGLSVIDDPLNAYESVFCKSLRILGGKRVEARYFNEANWCRLYRRTIWDGLRFTEGHFAQDIRIAGPLYSRMDSVVDVNEVLYYWLQEPQSVTHSQRTSQFWRDNLYAAAENFMFARNHGVTPYRNYFGLTSSLRDEKNGLRKRPGLTTEEGRMLRKDTGMVRALLRTLKPHQRGLCFLLTLLRRAENLIYDKKIHHMK
ncbi:MAG: Glycosyltransferase involved in cell wall biogenesis [Bifidobacterium crudilactis]|jgi:glycosyltransferase involved in cell wall biosynthesis|uniref:glycosyltransferase family 2 protein n=1 Tax=Bifidobacterium crudilactis TaxID=327277 RepID=UPI003A5BC5C5